jgi:hypothetical protein
LAKLKSAKYVLVMVAGIWATESGVNDVVGEEGGAIVVGVIATGLETGGVLPPLMIGSWAVVTDI